MSIVSFDKIYSSGFKWCGRCQEKRAQVNFRCPSCNQKLRTKVRSKFSRS